MKNKFSIFNSQLSTLLAIVLTFAGCNDTKEEPQLSAASTVNFDAAGGSETLAITANIAWTVSGHEAVTWLDISPSSGNGNQTVTVTATKNTVTTARSAELTVLASGVSSVRVTVTQAAAEAPALSITNPANVTIDEGQGATFRVIASGGVTPYKYQWQISTNSGGAWSDLENLTGSIESATSNELKFLSVEAALNGAWGRCVLTDANNVSVTSDRATLTVNARPVIVSTIAGNGVRGFADGTGAVAQFDYPGGVAIDAAGNVYVADTQNNRIRKITPTGEVATLAGGGGSQSFADGTGAAARFNNPRSVAVDAAGYVYVADTQNHRIRKITPAGAVTTLAGSGMNGFADGTGTAAQLNGPYGVAVDSAGNIYVADMGNNRIRKITPQ